MKKKKNQAGARVYLRPQPTPERKQNQRGEKVPTLNEKKTHYLCASRTGERKGRKTCVTISRQLDKIKKQKRGKDGLARIGGTETDGRGKDKPKKGRAGTQLQQSSLEEAN